MLRSQFLLHASHHALEKLFGFLRVAAGLQDLCQLALAIQGVQMFGPQVGFKALGTPSVQLLCFGGVSQSRQQRG